MPKYPLHEQIAPQCYKPEKLIKFLQKLGFQKGRGRGSHIHLTHLDGRWTQVAVHPGPVPMGTLKKIIAQVELSEEEITQLK